MKLSACAAVAGAGLRSFAEPQPKPGDIRALLLHLGHNMWCDWFPADADPAACPKAPKPDARLRSRDDLWLKTTDYAAKKGVNMIVIDVGEGVVYPSHPELAIEGSWSPDRLRAEVRRLRAMGVEAVPKLNFSTSHNGWLKQYRRMVSSVVLLPMIWLLPHFLEDKAFAIWLSMPVSDVVCQLATIPPILLHARFLARVRSRGVPS